MNRERAETYLRALAEAELRRATMQPWEDAQRAGHAGRVKRVAQVLASVGALDAGVADQILGDFELALGARQMGQVGSVAGWFPRRATLARGVSVPPATAGGSAAGRPVAGAAAGQAHAPVPLGQIVRAGGTDARSKVCLLSYARVAGGPQFSVFARTRQRSGWWEPSGPRRHRRGVTEPPHQVLDRRPRSRRQRLAGMTQVMEPEALHASPAASPIKSLPDRISPHRTAVTAHEHPIRVRRGSPRSAAG